MEYTELNDYEIIYMIREKCEEAYNMMYEKYYPLISTLANKYYKKYKDSGIEYEELYQEGLFGLNNAITDFKDDKNCLFYTYLLICVKREMERIIKSKNRNKHKILTDALSLEQEISSTDLQLFDILADKNINIQDSLIKTISYKEILDLKYELTTEQALVYELKLNSFSNSEIAILLDKSYRNIDNILRIIKRKIKKYINEKEEFML